MNIKLILPQLIVAAVCVMMAGNLKARTPVGSETVGAGVQLGDPTAITLKILPTPKFGLQLFLGGGHWHHDYNYHRGSMFITGMDVIFHPVMIYDKWKTCALNLTLGAGGALGLFRGWYVEGQWDHNWYYDRYYHDDKYYACLFIRMVTGLSLWFKKFPLEAYIEITPAIRLINPDPVGFHVFWVGAGGRWYF